MVGLIVKYMRQEIGRMGHRGRIGHRMAQVEKLRMLVTWWVLIRETGEAMVVQRMGAAADRLSLAGAQSARQVAGVAVC